MLQDLLLISRHPRAFTELVTLCKAVSMSLNLYIILVSRSSCFFLFLPPHPSHSSHILLLHLLSFSLPISFSVFIGTHRLVLGLFLLLSPPSYLLCLCIRYSMSPLLLLCNFMLLFTLTNTSRKPFTPLTDTLRFPPYGSRSLSNFTT